MEKKLVERTFNQKGVSDHVLIYTPDHRGFFKTTDGQLYHRQGGLGPIRRIGKKVKGKAARRAEKKARREARCQAQVIVDDPTAPSAAET